MPVLKNPRHELFAELLALGKTATEAYGEAGYTPGRRDAASRLSANVNIRARLRELQAIAIKKTVLTKQWVIERLIEVAARSMQHRGVMRGGRAVAFRFDAAGANRALELLGKEIGMFVDRAEQDTNLRVISAQPVTEEDWEAKYAKGEPQHTLTAPLAG